MSEITEADVIMDLYKIHAYIPHDAQDNPLTPYGNFYEGYQCGLKATKPDTITLSITEYEQLLADKKRIDWLESSKEHHGFCHVGYGEYRYYAHQIKDYPSAREVIDQAKAKDKP